MHRKSLADPPDFFCPPQGLERRRRVMAANPNPVQARDIAYHLHPQTSLVLHEQTGPVVMARGRGVRVYDDAGKEYIDAMAGMWSASLGFSERRLVEAATRQMEA